jgi:hypothetical protein
MSWIWMNMALAAVFLTAWCGIPLWMVLRHRSWGPEPADSYYGSRAARPAPVVSSQTARPAPVAAFDYGEHAVAVQAA